MTTPTDTETTSSLWLTAEIAGTIVVGTTLGLAMLMAAVCILPPNDLIWRLFGLAMLGAIAAEMVDMVGKEAPPPCLQGLKRYGHYVRSLNHARFLWRVVSWSLLAAAGQVLVAILKDAPSPMCTAMTEVRWWDANRGWLIMVFVSVVFVSGIVSFVLFKCRNRARCRLMRGCNFENWAAGLAFFAVLVALIGGMSFHDCIFPI